MMHALNANVTCFTADQCLFWTHEAESVTSRSLCVLDCVGRQVLQTINWRWWSCHYWCLFSQASLLLVLSVRGLFLWVTLNIFTCWTMKQFLKNPTDLPRRRDLSHIYSSQDQRRKGWTTQNPQQLPSKTLTTTQNPFNYQTTP